MTSRDFEIYNEIGLLLNEIAPGNVKLVKIIAYIFREDLSCEIKYIFVDDNDEEIAFVPDHFGEISHQIGERIFELSEFYEDQMQPPWKGFNCVLSRKTGNVRLEFIY